MTETASIATSKKTTTKMIKKKRFRPKKLFKKVFGNKDTEYDASKPEQLSIKTSATHDTAPTTYEPPAPASHLAAVAEDFKENKKPVGDPRSSPGKAIRKSKNKKQRQRQPTSSSQNSHSNTKVVSEWEDFGSNPATTAKAITAATKEELPFDERTDQERIPSFFTKLSASGNVEIVDTIYNDLNVEDTKLAMYNSNSERSHIDSSIPSVVSVEQRDLIMQQDLDDSAVAEGMTKSRSFAPFETETGLCWKVLTDGTLEMREAPDETPLIAAVEIPVVVPTKNTDAEADLKVSSVTTQKARSMSPTSTVRVIMARRIKSLSSSRHNKTLKQLQEETDPTEIMSDLEKQEEIHRSVRQEDPAPFVSSNLTICAVPEVDDEQNNCSEMMQEPEIGTEFFELPARAFDTTEGMEVLTSFGKSIRSTEQDDDDSSSDEVSEDNDSESGSGEDDADTTFDLAEFEDANDLLISSEDEDGADYDQEHPKHLTSAAADGTKELDRDSQAANNKSTTSHYVANLPRPSLGRSRESVEAERQHGSIHQIPPIGSSSRSAGSISPSDRLSTSVWSPAESEDADDEMTASFAPSLLDSEPGIEAGVSFFDAEDEDSDDETTEVKPVRSRKGSKKKLNRQLHRGGADSDESDFEEGDTLTSFGADLTEMATELRAKGPGVLMEWMDLRPLK